MSTSMPSNDTREERERFGTESMQGDPRRDGVGRVMLVQSTVTLVEGSTFCVSGHDGDIDPLRPDGLFVQDTRVLSRWQLRLDGMPIEPLGVVSAEPYETVFVGRAAPRAGHAEGTVIVERHRMVGQGMREDIRLRNYGAEPAGVDLTLTAEADFVDLFLVKEHRLAHVPPVGHHHVGGDLVYWLDRPGSQRGIRISAPGALSSPQTLTFRVVVPARDEWRTTIEAVPSAQGVDLEFLYPADRPVAETTPALRMRDWRDETPDTVTSNRVLADALRTSERDLGALRIQDPKHPEDDVVAAGAPWFMALFGRDSLLTGWMMLPFAPRLTLGTLRTLSRLQGLQPDARTEEQPGRILHEVRLGADLSLALGGASVYYGSIDSTPLFVMLVGRALRWGIPAQDLAEFRPAVERALDWIIRWGDRDGDGFVEYLRSSDRGLLNQGWKDSSDGITFRTGVAARPPVALAEVQGYSYAAMRAGADLLRAWGDDTAAQDWDERASVLRTQFDEAFWMPEENTYALALDADKRQVDAVASNAGHCLWSGIVPTHRADAVIDRLIAPDMFTGFGIRTLSTQAGAYNPVSYHNGSVWPHDTALAAAGMAAYGRRDAAATVIEGLLDALEAHGGRLPELFCGFSRVDKPVPVSYPASCSPQAWAAATPFELLRIAIGLDLDLPRGIARVQPTPATIGPIRVDRLPAGPARLDVRADAAGAELRGLQGDAEGR
ncbi:glycogen debranching N-terminal domain-containing protein [Microbacterium trichothecenolyticum]|nr:glycogen debranching N-terminal domain-containing protein [Microbacterium trichothecenolyticum]